MNIQSSGHFVAGRYGDAAAVAKDVLNRHPDDATARILVASSLASAGQAAEASIVLASAPPIAPSLIDRLGVINWLAGPDRERLRASLHQAGWQG